MHGRPRASYINPDVSKKEHARSNLRPVLRLVQKDRTPATNEDLESKLAKQAHAHAGEVSELKKAV